MFYEITLNKLLKSLEEIKYGVLELTTPEGKKYIFEGKEEGPRADIKIHDLSIITNAVAKGDVGFAEDYRDGKWDSDNLSSLLYLIIKNDSVFDEYFYGNSIYKYIAKLYYFFNSNTLRGSKRNIHAHYDLGNEFYSLWLDETMTYSSAIFKNKNEDLSQAQNNKYDRILDIIGNKSCNILEIGCGWGGFAERAVREGDHKIKGITISNQQYNFAKERISNICQNSNIVIEDYRKQNGKFDNIVSIEMFEAVGEKYWPIYFSKIASLLKDKGQAIIQTITIKDDLFEAYRKSGDMIRSFIFPGGMLPSQARFEHEANKAGLKISDKFDFGTHYALTLDKWLKNFDAQIRKIKMLGFDEKFIRIWRLYLSTCIASFSSERTNVMQVSLGHA
ncbi:MAG: cyclopropane-fatty-acyl-phospholipid synthase family protein [Rickettsiales bacterium]|nr:cyclopropane-fatty-acyl-phospholipid synthase family protein [Rickettsiales bacterium]